MPLNGTHAEASAGRDVFSDEPAAEPSRSREWSLADYVGLLLESKWLILAAVLVGGIIAAYNALNATPIYRTNALIQIERKAPSTMAIGLGGEGPTNLGGGLSTSAEMEIMQSRSMLRQAAAELDQNVDVTAHYFPVIGKAIARLRNGGPPAGALFGMSEYAWGGEQLEVSRFSVPDRYRDKRFELRVTGDEAYRLYRPDGSPLLQGKVGKTARGADGEISIYVARMEAHEGARFHVRPRSEKALANQMGRGLNLREQGRGTGIVRVTVTGADKMRIEEALDALTDVYLRQNVERKSKQAEQMLDFINSQLPTVKANLEDAEAALDQHQLDRGAVDLGAETENKLDQLSEIEKSISELELKRAELSQRFTDEHPNIERVDRQLARLRSEKRRFNKELEALPAVERESARLMRDVQVTNELYSHLLNKAQELKIAKAGTVGNIRIIDEAAPAYGPVKPNKQRILTMGLVLGLIAGIGLAVLRRMLNRSVHDPDEVEQELGLSVFAAITHSEAEDKLSRQRRKQRGKGTGEASILALQKPDDQAIESLRSLRTSLQFALMETDNNVIAISGSAPEVGKSFLAVNFAAVLADGGKRTLIIDGDMRKGHLHEFFGGERTPGLSDVISGKNTLADVIRATTHEQLFFLSTGTRPPNPSELLLSSKFAELLDAARRTFDLVILDTPPVLAVTDASIIGRHAGTTFLALRADRHPMKEIDAAVKRLRQDGVNLRGAIFNDMPIRKGYYGYYGYGRYGYRYAYYKYK